MVVVVIEVVAVIRELGVLVIGSGFVSLFGELGFRVAGWFVGSGAVVGAFLLLLRSSGSAVGASGFSGGVCRSSFWMRICCRMAGSS